MEIKTCPACKNENNIEVNFCELCDFPFEGSEKEKSIHIGKFIGKKGIIIDSEDSLTKSRNLLLIAAGFYLVGSIINYPLLLEYLILLIVNVIIILVITTSALLLKKAPLLFLIIPLTLLLIIYISNFIINPDTLLNGIIFKVLILGSLVYSLYNYVASKKFKKKFNM